MIFIQLDTPTLKAQILLQRWRLTSLSPSPPLPSQQLSCPQSLAQAWSVPLAGATGVHLRTLSWNAGTLTHFPSGWNWGRCNPRKWHLETRMLGTLGGGLDFSESVVKGKESKSLVTNKTSDYNSLEIFQLQDSLRHSSILGEGAGDPTATLSAQPPLTLAWKHL